MLKEGTWYLESLSDPRWNTAGRGTVGGFEMPEACRTKIRELEQQYGTQPADLIYGYEKY